MSSAIESDVHSTDLNEEELSFDDGGVMLRAKYSEETFTYYYHDEDDSGGTLDAIYVTITRAASTTSACGIVSKDHDATGLLLWPATHLLCQFLLWSLNPPSNACQADIGTKARPHALGRSILELGCGCGLVSALAAKAATSSTIKMNENRFAYYAATDMDERLLKLSYQNIIFNSSGETESKIVDTHLLKWGNPEHLDATRDQLKRKSSCCFFDTIVAADLVYPATTDATLCDLFATVSALLTKRPEGTFYLSFCPRDGPQTASRLISAASKAGFVIDTIPTSTIIPLLAMSKVPPFLGSIVLVLKRNKEALTINKNLGGVDCLVFPDLMAKLEKAEEDSSIEEWDAPPWFDNSDNNI